MSVIKENFNFLSSNGKNTINGFVIRKNEPLYKAIIQISHGMVEHLDRYIDFMSFMAENGYVMVGNDHLGHKNSVESEQELGYFADNDGYKCILEDLARTSSRTRKMFPQLKLILLGHSMGSFYARVFAAKHHNLFDAIIISGTGGTNPMANIGKTLIKTMMLFKGKKYRSKFVKNLTFKGFSDRVENPVTDLDWISSDKDKVNEYVKDKYCTFTFTLSGYLDLLQINLIANSENCYNNFKKDVPILIISGDMDPVGDYGKGVKEVFDSLKAHGQNNLELKLYPNARHEVLNEINRQEVYNDILVWSDKQI